LKGNFIAMKKFFLICVAISLLIAGCSNSSAPVLTSVNTPTAIPISSFLLSSDSNPTPTPFQPIAPTPTKTIMVVPTSTPTPVPIVPQFPTSDVSNMPTATGQVNILILGSDYRAGRGFRTDVIMLLSINTDKKTVTLTSFPRDLYVSIPGIGMERINTAQEYGGFELTKATFQQNFGVTPTYYVMTNFDGFKSIIDTLGGVDVDAATTLKDECSVRSKVDGMGYCTVPAGSYHMDGEMALWYVRSRHSSSDFDRTRRAQEVITAVFKKIISMDGLNRASELYDLFKLNVETNIPVSEVVTLLPMATMVAGDTSVIRRYAIGSSDVYNYITPAGAMVLVPDQAAVLSIIQQALN
jgi:LCP family protein required for cell wall assembly